MSKPCFTRAILYSFLAVIASVVVSSANDHPVSDSQWPIVPQDHDSYSLSLTSDPYLSVGPSEISKLLDDNFRNGTLTLDFSTGWDEDSTSPASQLLEHLLSKHGEQLRGNVWQIVVPRYAGDMETENIVDSTSPSVFNESQFVDFVAKVKNLKGFRWQDAHRRIPEKLVTALGHNHPDSCLHLENVYMDSALANSSLLCSIEAIALDSCTSQYVWPSISKAFAKGTRIRSLTVKPGRCGCRVSGERQALNIYKDTHFPPLEELFLVGYQGYDFDGPAYEVPELYKRMPIWERVKLQLRTLFSHARTTTATESQRTNLEAWREAMDWTNLRILEVNLLSVNTLKNFDWPLPSLKSFRSDLLPRWMMESPEEIQEHNNALSAFISRFPSQLESLGLRNFCYPFSLNQIADKHGQSLKQLELRGNAYLNDTELEQTREQFPALELLGTDLHRNGSWPNSTLSTISSFPSLKHLTLWLKLGCDAYTLPLLTNSSATLLFHELRRHKNGTELTSTTFYLGDYSQYRSDSYTIDLWSDGRQAKVECAAEPGTAVERGSCTFHGYDPGRPDTASSYIRRSDKHFAQLAKRRAKMAAAKARLEEEGRKRRGVSSSFIRDLFASKWLRYWL